MEVKELHIVPENRTVAQVRAYGTCIMRDQTAKLLLDKAEAGGHGLQHRSVGRVKH